MLYPGDHVQTLQRAKAAVLIDGVRVQLAPRTHVMIPLARPTPKGPRTQSRLKMITGWLLIWLIGATSFEVATDGAIASADGTRFSVHVADGGLTTLTVIEGDVLLSNGLGAVTVSAGHQSEASASTAPTRPMRVDPSGLVLWETSLNGLWLDVEARKYPDLAPEQLERLLTECLQRVEEAPDIPGHHIEAGDVLQDLGRLPEAEAAYEAAVEAASERPAELPHAQASLGMNLLLQGRFQEAAGAFTAASQTDTGNPGYMASTALAAMATGGTDGLARAQSIVSEALDRGATDPWVQITQGLVCVRAGDADAAAEAFTRAVELRTPAPYQALAYLSHVELARGRGAVALATARRAVELAPHSGLAQLSLATAEFFADDLAAARDRVRKALALSPDSASGHLLASDIEVASGNMDGGLREAQLAVSLDPGHAPAYSALGTLWLARSDLKAAEHAFVTALDLWPNLVAARTGMGVTYARQGKLGKAMALQKASIALDSRLASSHNNLGAALLALGELQEAVAQFRKAVELQPEFGAAHSNLALAHLDLNQFAVAVREGELAVRLGEDSARAHTTLARVYLEQGRTTKAWASLRRALELDEDYALAHLQLAEAYVRMGRSLDATRHQLDGIVRQPSAMLETREYSRTEVRAEAGSFVGSLKLDGRADEGQNSYFASVEHEDDDGDRSRSDLSSTTWLGIAGRQTGPRHSNALYVALHDEDRDRPGKAEPGGGPQDADYESEFSGRLVDYLVRRPLSARCTLTLRAGYADSEARDSNPDSLLNDPKPFRRLNTRYSGPSVEARVDARAGSHGKLAAGLAVADEEAKVSGVLVTEMPAVQSTDLATTAFASTQDRDAATAYLEYETSVDGSTRFLVGGRLATRDGMRPVLRPKASFRRRVGDDGTLVLLTRPVLADDVSQIAPVDDWALRDRFSMLDFGLGGYGQSYEVQYELLPANGSLLRLSAFQRAVKNYIVDLSSPAWAPGQVGEILGAGTLRGAQIEWEHRLAQDLSAGLWLRYTDSENEDAAGLQIPYQPRLAGQLRLDYIDTSGLRVATRILYVGRRYADVSNATRLGSYTTVNLWAAKQLDLHTDVFVSIENLLDRDHAYWQGYPERGRQARVGVEYRF